MAVDVKCDFDLCHWCSMVSGHGICKKDEIKIDFTGECESFEYANEEDYCDE